MMWLIVLGVLLIVFAAALSFRFRRKRNPEVHFNYREREERAQQQLNQQHRKQYDIGEKGNQPPIQ